MNNIFKNAYFGKSYKTRDGRKAIYGGTNEESLLHDLMFQTKDGEAFLALYNADGTYSMSRKTSWLDIVSEWTEEKEADSNALCQEPDLGIKKTISDYTIFCTPEQTLKALKLGAPIECCIESDGVKFPKESPTAEQMIGWFDMNEILIHVYKESDWLYSINHFEGVGRFQSRREATLAAIDEALNLAFENL